MKKSGWMIVAFIFVQSLAVPAAFATDMGSAAGVTGLVDKDSLEGWILSVDYRANYFRLLDPRGFQKRIATKPGMIGEYKLGDKVRVEIDPDYKRARTIEKIS